VKQDESRAAEGVAGDGARLANFCCCLLLVSDSLSKNENTSKFSPITSFATGSCHGANLAILRDHESQAVRMSASPATIVLVENVGRKSALSGRCSEPP
jgi:hypothetical protein